MKVLILAYDFPPFVSVGGLRPYSWYRYLGEFGVEPVVVTRQWANEYGDERDHIAPSATDEVEVEEGAWGTILRAPYRPTLANRLLLQGGPDKQPLLRRLVTGWYELVQFHAPLGPKVALLRAARRYLEQHRVDAIVATGEPFVLFRYASLLSREFGVPWVADYRDPWSQNRLRATSPLAGRWMRGVERGATRSAAAVTTVSDTIRQLLAKLHPGKPIEVVLNGYDPEAVAAAADVRQGHQDLTVSHVGSIYPFHPAESVLRVFDGHVSANPESRLRLECIGVNQRASLEALVGERFPALAARTTFLPRLPNVDAIRALAEANVFLLFNYYAYPGTKIFDYLALRRRILLCYSDDPEARKLKRDHYNIDHVPGADDRALEGIVQRTRAGVVVRDAAHLAAVLDDLSREFRDTGEISCDTQDFERYSRRAQAGRLAEILKEVAG